MHYIMLDLETLGTKPDSAVVSIGAVMFNDLEISENIFHEKIDIADCIDNYDFSINGEVLKWWLRQSPEAQTELHGERKLKEVLCDFRKWVELYSVGCQHVKVWGNSSSFDNVMLRNAYEEAGIDNLPWKWYNDRCYRTLKNMYPDVKYVHDGIPHCSVDDAYYQAAHVIKISKKHQLYAE